MKAIYRFRVENGLRRLLLPVSVNLDKILVTIGALAGLVICFLPVLRSQSGPISVIFGATLFLLCAVYLYRGLGSRALEMPRLKAGASACLVINILYFSILAYGLLALQLRPEPYVRPVGYFISMFLLAGLLVLEVLSLPDDRRYAPLVLVKIIIVPLSLVWSQMLLFPTVTSADAAFHQSFTREMLETGSIPGGWGYFNFPVMHLVNGVTSLFTGLDFRLAGIFSITFLQIAAVSVAVFLIGRLAFNDRVGLLGALFLGTSSFIFWTYWTVPFSFGGIFLALLIYLLLKKRQVGNPALSFLAVLTIVISIVSHQLVALCMVMVLIVFYVGARVFDSAGEQSGNSLALVSLNTVLIFTLGMVAWWMYVTGDLFIFIRLMGENFEAGSLNQAQVAVSSARVPVYEITQGRLIFNNIGKLLIFAVAFTGCVHMLSNKFRNPYTFGLAAGGLALLGIVFLGVVNYGPYDILSYRWEYYSQILLAVPMAVAFFLLSSLARQRALQVLLFAAAALGISFLIIFSTRASMDRPLFAELLSPRQAQSLSEVQALETVPGLTQRPIALDSTAAAMLSDRQLGRFVTIPGNIAFYAKDFSGYQDDVIIVRKDIVERGLPGTDTITKIDYDVDRFLVEGGFSRVYTTGTVSAYVGGEDKSP